MKRLLTFIVALLFATPLFAQNNLPQSIDIYAWESGVATAGHVQGIAVDTKQEYIYVSFTTVLVKCDMQGRVVGSVTGILGHLGCLEFNDEDGRLYGSLEYKNDAIGRGIMKQEGSTKQLKTGFYVAIFDVDKITRKGMSAERDGVMTTVLLKSVVNDYLAEIKCKSGEVLKHRHGCSGFDGISFGPAFDGSGKRMLTIAYGIYGDKKRSDNDYQVLLQYDTYNWAKYETPLLQENQHSNGPAKPYGKYFVYTGNTTYGVQNLEYDQANKLWLLACYPGKKEHFSNFSLYTIDGSTRATKQRLQGVEYQKRGEVVSLCQRGLTDKHNNAIRGWKDCICYYGLCALGNNYFYIATHKKAPQGKAAHIRLAHFVGSDTESFRDLK